MTKKASRRSPMTTPHPPLFAFIAPTARRLRADEMPPEVQA